MLPEFLVGTGGWPWSCANVSAARATRPDPGEVALQFEFTWLANESCLSEMLRDRRFPPAIGNEIRRDVHSQTQSKRVHS
jgi:hypothetical protein